MTITATLYGYTTALLFAVMFVGNLTVERVIFLGAERDEPQATKCHWLQCAGATEEDSHPTQEPRA